jgi:hypothetical protein
MDKGRTMGVWITAILSGISGLVFLTAPHFDESRFTELAHLSGKIRAVRRTSRPRSANASVSVTLSNGSDQRTIRIQTSEWEPANLARLSLGAVIDAWVDQDPKGEPFAWEVERDGKVLVGYRDRLETSRRLQHSIASIGWPLLGGGAFLSLLALRRRSK